VIDRRRFLRRYDPATVTSPNRRAFVTGLGAVLVAQDEVAVSAIPGIQLP
jgi:hypothetical protein